MKLGKLPPKLDPRTLKLENYLVTARLPVVPGGFAWSKWCPRELGMMRNDALGDCVAAAAGHAIQSWTGNALGAAQAVTVTDASVVSMYSAISGYDPADPSSDRGAYMLDGCRYLRATGLEGHTVRAYVAVNPRHVGMVRAACWLFGGLYFGATLYDDIWTSAVWDAPPIGESEAGGHAMFVTDVDRDGLSVITWGRHQRVTWDWWYTCPDEAYALLSEDMLANGQSPPGFELERLAEDLSKVTA